MRRLLGGEEVVELDSPINITIHTKAPGKWKIIDMETGQEYVGSDIPNEYGQWIRIKDRDK